MTEHGDALDQVRALTSAAAAAASRGRWDVVDACYRDRQGLLPTLRLSAEQVEQLAAIDRVVGAQASVAQAAVAELMREAAALRRRIAGLRQAQGTVPATSRMIRLEG